MIEFNKKVAIIGEGGVGKTTLMNRYINGKFSKMTEMTVGSEFFTKNFVKNNIQGKMLIWDLGGQERFRPMMKGYLTGSEGIFLVYDLTRLMTLIKLHDWIELLNQAKVPIDGTIPIVLVGTKKDIYDPSEEDEYEREEYIQELMETCVIARHFETSSLTNENIEKCFEHMIDIFIRNKLNENIDKIGLLEQEKQCS